MRRQLVDIPQLALAASLLIAVSVSLTWLVARRRRDLNRPAPAAVSRSIRAVSEPMGSATADFQPANFADAQYDGRWRTSRNSRRAARRARSADGDGHRAQPGRRSTRPFARRGRRSIADPANTFLNSHLADARRRKLELLRRATALGSTGGD